MLPRSQKGQVMAAVLVLLVILSALVPLMVFYTQTEARWTNKQNRNTTAFHLAEAGVEKAYLALSLSTQSWRSLQNGSRMASYDFDRSYNDVSGGSYTISITSGPGTEQATVISVGIDSSHKETRAIKAVYSNATLGNVAVMGVAGVDVSGNNLTVEWGSIVSPNTITPNTENHPSYWSSSGITGLDTDASPPNCDSPNCWWWHAYYPIPSIPSINFSLYKASAIASGVGPCGAYYVNGNKSGTCSDSSGKPYYITGNWSSFDGPIAGTVIILGNFSTGNGVMNGTSIAAKMPQEAWKQYCNDWSFFETTYYDTPYSACPGLYSTYKTPTTVTYTISPVVRGVLYVGGNFSGPTGGGNTVMVYGSIFVKGTATLNSNSNVTIYFDADAASRLETTQVVLSRASWQDTLVGWPGSLAY